MSPVTPDFLARQVAAKLDPIRGIHKAKVTLGAPLPRSGDVVLRSNDYLDLARDTRIAAAKANALMNHGHGEAISRVFAHHNNDAHRQFEHRLAGLTGAEDAALTMSGYSANTGLIEAFAVQGHPVYIDQFAHASLWSGITSAGARAIPFRHNDMLDLVRKAARFGAGLIVVDALYSTTGAIAPLEELADFAELQGHVLIVDETHSFGVHGPNGAGLVSALGLADKVHFRTFGLSKAIAARGGVVVGSARNIEYFRYEALPMIFSTSVLVYEVAGFNATLDIVASEPWRARLVHDNHAYLKRGLLSYGFAVAQSDSQLLALMTGTDDATSAFRDHLAHRGIHGAVFVPPATPVNGALIRFTIHAGLTRGDLDRVLDACVEARSRLGISPDCLSMNSA